MGEWSEWFRKARTERGLTRADVARHLGVSVATVFGWERGVDRKPTMQMGTRIAELLGSSPPPSTPPPSNVIPFKRSN